MESILPLLIQVIAGGIGGNGIGRALKDVNLGTMGNTISGAIGGLGATALVGAIPGLEAITGMGLAGDGISGIVGGGALTAIVSVVRKMMADKSDK